ncbi:MAG: ABC transporter permease [Candidatus Hadarchaeaceae archaeon]
MGELVGIYALWYREVKVFLRESSRIVASFVNPLIWILAFGFGLGASVFFEGTRYIEFIFPGIIAMNVIFTSVFFGLYMIWDKRVDFFKEVMVAPLKRTTLFVGKMLGGCTDSLIQASILLVIGPLLGVKYTPYVLAVLLVFILLAAAGMVSIGLAIGAQMTSFEGFGLVQSFVILPLFFLSGALYPLDNLPVWLRFAIYINPLSYVVDGMRGTLLGINYFPIAIDFGITLAFVAVMIAVGTLSFKKMI